MNKRIQCGQRDPGGETACEVQETVIGLQQNTIDRLTIENNNLKQDRTEIHWWCGHEDLTSNRKIQKIMDVCGRDISNLEEVGELCDHGYYEDEDCPECTTADQSLTPTVTSDPQRTNFLGHDGHIHG